jgi:hypothetical protein
MGSKIEGLFMSTILVGNENWFINIRNWVLAPSNPLYHLTSSDFRNLLEI